MPTREPDGSTVWHGFMSDITQRKNAEEALRKSEEQLRLITDNTTDNIAITTFDLKATYVYVNPSVKTVLGYEPEDLLGRSFFDFVHPDDKKVLFPLLKKYVDKIFKEFVTRKSLPIQETIEYRFKNKLGNWFYLQSTVNLIGKQLLAVTRDITERKLAEKKIQSNLEEKEILLRELYHRTKNNMQVISSMLRLKARKIANKDIQFSFREIENKIQAMALVHNKLYESHDLSSLNLKTYFSDLVVLIHRSYLMGDSRIKLVFEGEDAPVLIDTAIPMGLVLNELITNALKHAFPNERNGEIYVQLKADPKKGILIEVSDNGVGLPEGFSAESDSRLGLETVIDLVEHQLGGEVTFESKNGCTCRISIKKELYRPRV